MKKIVMIPRPLIDPVHKAILYRIAQLEEELDGSADHRHRSDVHVGLSECYEALDDFNLDKLGLTRDLPALSLTVKPRSAPQLVCALEEYGSVCKDPEVASGLWMLRDELAGSFRLLHLAYKVSLDIAVSTLDIPSVNEEDVTRELMFVLNNLLIELPRQLEMHVGIPIVCPDRGVHRPEVKRRGYPADEERELRLQLVGDDEGDEEDYRHGMLAEAAAEEQ